MVKLKEFAIIIAFGVATWSIIFSIGYGRPFPYLPYPGSAMPMWATEYTSDPAVWIGGIIGWMVLCLIPGWPLFKIFKRYSKKFRQFVS